MKHPVARDRRLARAELAPQRTRILMKLSAIHRKALTKFHARLANLPDGR